MYPSVINELRLEPKSREVGQARFCFLVNDNPRAAVSDDVGTIELRRVLCLCAVLPTTSV
jgi:hypothetical protein